MKIKVLHILHSLQVGGLENGVVNLINNLDPGRFEHAVCCITHSGPMAERIIHPTTVVALGKGSGGDYLLPLKLARVIRKMRPDIVHTRNWGTIDGVVAARLAGVRRVVHGEHGREATDPTGANTRRKRFRKMLSPWIDGFVAVSGDLKAWLIDDVGVPEGKVEQIINGVDTERFKPAPDPAAAKAAMGMLPDSFVIGTVGRLDLVKDQQTLIRAFASVLAGSTGQTGKTILTIIGSGPEETNLKKLASELGIADAVYFMGERKDIPEVLRAMDVFVLPSIAEGISNTILEAMASGLPVVATAVGGNEELVKNHESGFLFAPGDAEALAGRLQRYQARPEEMRAQGANGRLMAVTQFSLTAMVDAYTRLYAAMAPCRRRG